MGVSLRCLRLCSLCVYSDEAAWLCDGHIAIDVSEVPQ